MSERDELSTAFFRELVGHDTPNTCSGRRIMAEVTRAADGLLESGLVVLKSDHDAEIERLRAASADEPDTELEIIWATFASLAVDVQMVIDLTLIPACQHSTKENEPARLALHNLREALAIAEQSCPDVTPKPMTKAERSAALASSDPSGAEGEQ